MINVLVTGATGFIGINLIKTLVKKKYKIYCLVRTREKARRLEQYGVEFIFGDIRDVDSLEPVKKHKYDYVYHFAGLTKSVDKISYYEVNYEGTKNVLKLIYDCSKNSLKQFIYCSSLAAVGPAKKLKPADEKSSYEPVSNYGKSKRMGEEAVLEYSRIMPVIVIRPPAVYGPYDTDIFQYFKLIENGIFLILGDDTFKFSLVYVEDLVKYTVRLAELHETSGEIFFIANDKFYKWSEIGGIIKKVSGKKTLKIKVPEFVITILGNINTILSHILKKPFVLNKDKLLEFNRKLWICSNDKVKNIFDVEFRMTPIETGIEETYKWYKNNNWL